MQWHRFLVFYYDDQDALILDGVRPLFRRLSGQVAAVAFLRHWRRGPHLKVAVRADDRTFAEVVRPAVDEIIGGYLAQHPSQRHLDPERELAAHQRLAVLEYERGPFLPWYPDNTIQYLPAPAPELAAADFLVDFHADTTELAFRMIEEVPAQRRPTTGLDLMIATAHAFSGQDMARAFVSFRSHAERYLCGFADSSGARAGWDRYYSENEAALQARVEAVVATLESGQSAVPFVRDWIAAATALRDWADERMRTGALAFPSPDFPATSYDADRIAEVSPFHRTLYADPRWQAEQSSPAFFLYRLIINSTYRYLTRLGLAPHERFLLCHLAASAVEKRYGIVPFGLATSPAGAAGAAGPVPGQ
jgi:Lantibiotic biosynthesis dehydratase C-term